MNTIIILLVIAIIALTVEISFKPRVDETRDGELLLWYGRTNRKYIKL